MLHLYYIQLKYINTVKSLERVRLSRSTDTHTHTHTHAYIHTHTKSTHSRALLCFIHTYMCTYENVHCEPCLGLGRDTHTYRERERETHTYMHASIHNYMW